MRTLHFLLSLVGPGVLLGAALLSMAASATFASTTLGTGAAIGGGIAAALGIWLGYWVGADWSNLNVIRTRLAGAAHAPEGGKVSAFTGTIRTEGEPLVSPFTGVACAAYIYEVAGTAHNPQRGSRRTSCAQGFHQVAATLEGATERLRLLALPDVEDDLRENVRGTDWETQARALLARIEDASPASQLERHSRLLELRRGAEGDVHHDYLMSSWEGEPVDGLAFDEEHVPVDCPVCVVGTYDRERVGISAERARVGPNLIVYRGTPEEVLARVGAETATFAKVALVLLALGIGALVAPVVLSI